MWCRVSWKPSGNPTTKERRADLNVIERAQQVLGGKGAVARRLRQCRSFDLNHRHIDLSGRIEALAPEALAVAI